MDRPRQGGLRALLGPGAEEEVLALVDFDPELLAPRLWAGEEAPGVAGPEAEAFTAAVTACMPAGHVLERLHPEEGRWVLGSPDAATLCDSLAGVRRPAGGCGWRSTPSGSDETAWIQ